MAVFMINICKFNGCGITFPRLADLIEHIEDVHIDYDPAVVEQKEASQPACIPLSYVLKFFTDATRRDFHSMPPLAPETRHTPAPDVRKRLFSAPKTPSVRSSTPTGSEMDEDEMMSPSEDSNDSWTTVEEYSSEYILRYGVKMNGGAGGAGGVSGASAAARSPGPCAGPQDKPFACPVPGCLKRYKNVNGIKYHSKNGHKKDGKIKKAYKCQCGKSYKTAQGLKTHSMVLHAGSGAAAAAAAVSVTSSAATPAPVVTSSGVTPTRTLAGLVVTAAPHRAPPIDTLDNKLVRIYDSIKAREFPTFTIPKHSLNIVRAGALTKIDRSRVTVQTVQSITPSYAAESN